MSLTTEEAIDGAVSSIRSAITCLYDAEIDSHDEINELWIITRQLIEKKDEFYKDEEEE